MEDKQPSTYLQTLKQDKNLENLQLLKLIKLEDVPQNKEYHPEGSVWNHTMLVVDQAAEIKEASAKPKVFMWGALLHDIGKITATRVRKGRITAYDHDKEGFDLATTILKELTDDEGFIHDVSQLVRWHMQPLFVSKNLPFSDLENMVSKVYPTEVALLSICDRFGRGGLDEAKRMKELQGVLAFLKGSLEHVKNGEKIEFVIRELEKEIN